MKSSIGHIPDDIAAKILGQTVKVALALLSEKEFQAAVVDLAKRCGWLIYHTYDSRKSNAGFPDLVLVKGRVVLFLELKSQDGKSTAPQVTWGEALADVGGNVVYYLFRPSDWSDIVKLLGG